MKTITNFKTKIHIVHAIILKPNAQRETELNWNVQFSSVSRCALNRQWPATIWRQNKRSSQVLHNRDILVNRLINVCRWTKSGDKFRWLANLHRPLPIIAARRRFIRGVSRNALYKCTILTYLLFNAQRKTELDWTIQLSSVQFSAVHWALNTKENINLCKQTTTTICSKSTVTEIQHWT